MKTIKYSVKDRIGYLTLNRPDSYNALNLEMLEELESFFNERMYDEKASVIILDGGQSKGFCAGLDMQSFGPDIFNMKGESAYNAQARMSRLVLAMRRIPQPVICCTHGASAGIGFSFVMASDIRILAKGSRFSAAFINIGLSGADMGSSYLLPKLIGTGRANEYLYTGNWMDDEEAMKLGFGSRLVEKDKLIETAIELADTMNSKNPFGLKITKEAVNMNIDAQSLEAALQMEDRHQMMIAFAMKQQ